MRPALAIIAVLTGFVAFQAWRTAALTNSQSAAMLAFVLIAVTTGLAGAVVLSSGSLRDFLLVRVIRIWLNRARAWADTNERD